MLAQYGSGRYITYELRIILKILVSFVWAEESPKELELSEIELSLSRLPTR
jgi:hypothetical protein